MMERFENLWKGQRSMRIFVRDVIIRKLVLKGPNSWRVSISSSISSALFESLLDNPRTTSDEMSIELGNNNGGGSSIKSLILRTSNNEINQFVARIPETEER